jgi:hypothetical protein
MFTQLFGREVETVQRDLGSPQGLYGTLIPGASAGSKDWLWRIEALKPPSAKRRYAQPPTRIDHPQQ